MEPLHAVTLGLIVLFVVLTLPFWRKKYGERYDDEQDFFRDNRPRMWGLIGGFQEAKHDAAAAAGQCLSCGADNDVAYDYCANCGARLPAASD